MRRVLSSWINILLPILICGWGRPLCAQDQPPDLPPVIIDYFYEPGCADCFRVRNHVLPGLEEAYEGYYTLRKYDIGQQSNIVTLVHYQEKLGITENEPVCMVVDYAHVLNGFAVIRDKLAAQVDQGIADRMAPGWAPPEPIAATLPAAQTDKTLETRLDRFTLPAVLSAGLIDGINPCAISTLVFFMSLLSVSRVKGRALLAVGITFCAASFLTYTAIGFGLLRTLHVCRGFPLARNVVDVVMTTLLAAAAFLSFRDAYRFKTTRDHRLMSLQLPHRLKLKIHGLMRSGLTARSLVAGALFIGVTVTALESVCTGQVYVPTLVLVIKTGQSMAKGAAWLLLYNAMFILPLVVVFALTYQGLKTETLLRWSKKQVVMSKMLLGFLFLALAGLLLWL